MPFSAIALLDFLEVSEGDWIVQNAANGAVGRLVAQLAAARGVRVLGLVRRADGVTELSEQGIGDVVATDDDGWRDRVREIVGDAPVVAGVDSVGGSAAGDVVSLLAEDGVLVVFGAMASPTLEISSGDVIFKQVVVKGFWGSKVFPAMDADKRARLMGELVSGIAVGHAHPAGREGLRARRDLRRRTRQRRAGTPRQDPAAPLTAPASAHDDDRARRRGAARPG